jgi:hypothetical protein
MLQICNGIFKTGKNYTSADDYDTSWKTGSAGSIQREITTSQEVKLLQIIRAGKRNGFGTLARFFSLLPDILTSSAINDIR